jgi:hypothetical protein
MKHSFNVSNGHANTFSASIKSKKQLGRSCLSDVWFLRMARRKHNLPTGRLKEQFWLSQWNDVSWCRKAMRNHFLHSGPRNKRLAHSCLSDIWNRQMALRTHKLPSGRIKNYFIEVDEEMFRSVNRPCELFLHHVHLKNRLRRRLSDF